MKILDVRFIPGPNIYVSKPILVARVDLEELTERESNEFPGFVDRLIEHLPGVTDHHCAKGMPGDSWNGCGKVHILATFWSMSRWN